MVQGEQLMEELLYRPPFEADSYLLQVTKGCSHNKCAFCTMYRDIPFRVLSEEEIRSQLEQVKGYHIERVFLENGDPFCLNAEKLKGICGMVHAYLPNVKTIAMYASIKNIMTKTDEELAALSACGINDLNIGVESGLDEALRLMNKGYTAIQAKEQLLRLQNAGIRYGANVIFGCAGRQKRKENALATAELLNETEPYLIFTGTIHSEPGCPLYEDMKSGRFAESTVGEYLEEEELFLEHLQVDDCFFFGAHPSNVCRMYGWLMDNQEEMIHAVRETRSDLADRLDQIPQRGGEGALFL